MACANAGVTAKRCGKDRRVGDACVSGRKNRLARGATLDLSLRPVSAALSAVPRHGAGGAADEPDRLDEAFERRERRIAQQRDLEPIASREMAAAEIPPESACSSSAPSAIDSTESSSLTVTTAGHATLSAATSSQPCVRRAARSQAALSRIRCMRSGPARRTPAARAFTRFDECVCGQLACAAQWPRSI